MAIIMLTQAFRGWSEDRMVIIIILVLAAAWLCWRIWKFTIIPALRPDEPKELPYLIPCQYRYI